MAWNTLTNGTTADADKVMENFNYVGMIPVGTILPWLKDAKIIEDGTSTTATTNKLIDSTATFTTKGVTTSHKVHLIDYYNAAETTSTSSSYAVKKTFTFDAGGTTGLFVSGHYNMVSNPGGNYAECRIRYYYTDASDAYSDVKQSYAYHGYTYTNPYPNKAVCKIEVELKRQSTTGTAYEKEDRVLFNEADLSITSVDSETQLTVSAHKFKITGISYTVIPLTLDSRFVECNGQTISDVDSLLNGCVVPNLNMMGSTSTPTSGSSVIGTSLIGGQLSNVHQEFPINYDTSTDNYSMIARHTVIFIMRVK